MYIYVYGPGHTCTCMSQDGDLRSVAAWVVLARPPQTRMQLVVTSLDLPRGRPRLPIPVSSSGRARPARWPLFLIARRGKSFAGPGSGKTGQTQRRGWHHAFPWPWRNLTQGIFRPYCFDPFATSENVEGEHAVREENFLYLYVCAGWLTHTQMLLHHSKSYTFACVKCLKPSHHISRRRKNTNKAIKLY